MYLTRISTNLLAKLALDDYSSPIIDPFKNGTVAPNVPNRIIVIFPARRNELLHLNILNSSIAYTTYLS